MIQTIITKSGINAVIAVSVATLFCASTARAGLKLVTSEAALGANDHIFWGHVGSSAQ